MSDLKNIISDFVEKTYYDSTPKEKEILKKISFLEILNTDYYQKRYSTVSIASFNKKSYCFLTNDYHLHSSSDINAKVHEEDHHYSVDSDDYNLMKEIIVRSEVFEKLKKFEHIVMCNQKFHQYVTAIENEQRQDPDFLTFIFSYSFLFKDFTYNFFNDHVKTILNNSGLSSFYCNTTKTEVYLDSSINLSKLDINSVQKFIDQWNDCHEKRVKSLNEGLRKISDVQKYKKKLNNKIDNIFDHIAKEKPFLFKPLNTDEISFSYYEIEGCEEKAGWDNGMKFRLRNKMEFDPESLNKHGIQKSEIYDLNLNNIHDYHEMQKILKPFIINYENELTGLFKGAFYGLDYIDSAVKGNTSDRYYIVAQYHNETVGMISFRSDKEENENISTIKHMEYVCVKDTFRGTGLTHTLYQKLASLFTDNNKILFNSMYSKQGAVKLPKLKDKIRKNNPGFLFIDKDLGNFDKNSVYERIFLREFNEHLINKISYIDRKNQIKLSSLTPILNNFYNSSIKETREQFKTLDKSEHFSYCNSKITELMDKLNHEIEKASIEQHVKQTLKNKSPKKKFV